MRRDFLGKIRSGISKLIEWDATPYIAITIILLYLLFPFYWTFVTSFKSMEEVFKWPPTLIPQDFTVSGYESSFTMAPTLTYILNSVIYSLSVAAFIIVIGTITTYGLSMYPYRGSDKIFLTFFVTRTIPPQSLWLPLIIFFSKMGLMNTRPPVIIFSIILTYPLCIWMLKGLFDAFPSELIDSASLDGCSKLGILFRVVMPVVAPGIAAVVIVAFLWTWASFMFPFLVINANSLKPLTVGIFYFVGDEVVMWNAIAATEVMAILPGIVFFILAQRHIVKGLAAGAIK